MAGRARLSLSNTVQLSISLLTERVSYRSLSHRFHLEKGNIHRIFFSFCERVNTLEEKLIKWPAGRSTPRLSDQPVVADVIEDLVLSSRLGGRSGSAVQLREASGGAAGPPSGPGSVGAHPYPYPPASRER